ncbi:cytidine deaminase [Corynebacterium mastitidis]|uniref:cytidine deaminase n=1 Tax=Corynebacterium mastitidis TaxID=161890 RepID=UPI00254BA570|nr:cytidine deaminase [Corynebacterium mastitidis]MDK8449642.1 cytidine deaminase [Corynebacterium mastitidis]
MTTPAPPPSPEPAEPAKVAPRLLAAAREAARRAWAPYSAFPVGAAVLTSEGEIVLGCNVENAAYGEAICAERNAVTSMVATGARPGGDASCAGDAGAAAGASKAPFPEVGPPPTVVAVAIVGLKAAPCWPCGACRQVLREFHCRHVIVEDESGRPLILPFDQILPHSFGPEALDTPVPHAPGE